MNLSVKEIIEEIDPEYYKCYCCGRFRHISQLHKKRSWKTEMFCNNINDCLKQQSENKYYDET